MKNLYRKARKAVKSAAPDLKKPVVPTFSLKYTTLFLYHQRMYEQIKHLPGDIVECGIGQGVTFTFLTTLAYNDPTPRTIWGFDSFEGFPEPTAEDDSIRAPKKGDWRLTSVSEYYKYVTNLGFGDDWTKSNVIFVKGFFEDSLQHYTGDQIAYLHLDVDLYASYVTTLEGLYDKVVPGGVILFDEYMRGMDQIKYPGAKQAIDEFFADKGVSPQRDVHSGKYYVIKPAA